MLKNNPELKKAVDNLIEAIKNTDEYKNYQTFNDEQNYSQEDLELIKQLKRVNIELIKLPPELRGSQREASLLNEYEELNENTVVYDFAHAEIKYTELCRGILSEVMDTIDL